MIRDGAFKALCIPLLGITVPLLARLIRYGNHTLFEIVLSNLFFILTSLLVWQGSVWMVAHLRRLQSIRQRFFIKILVMCLCTAAFGFTLSVAGALLWQWLFLGSITGQPAGWTGIISAGVAIVVTLLYEALFLSKERELDIKIVHQLDKDRVNAEINALKAELDPHFIFNSLTTLSHLISTEPEKAQAFTQKLALVYKYFLINKNRELISLDDELKFVEDYFFLLKIRYDDKVKMRFNISEVKQNIMVLPCSLQLLVENAIKHNRFTEQQPLNISISLTDDYLKVENNVHDKPYGVESTRIGLAHLNAHYKLMCNKDIIVRNGGGSFTVELPLIKQVAL